MGQRGPIRSTTSVRGLGLRRDGPAFEPPVEPHEIPQPPSWLNHQQREVWDWLIPALLEAGVPLLRIDEAMLSVVCVTVHRIRQCEERIDQEGLIVRGSRGKESVSPAPRIAARHTRTLLSLSKAFGMDPASRQRLRLTRPQTETARKSNLLDILDQ